MKPKKKLRQKETARPNSWIFYVFSGFLILFIPVFHIPSALDEALIPRVLALSLFSIVMAVLLFGSQYYDRLDFSVLRQKVFPVLAGYLLITIISIVFAVNARESNFDIIRTFLMVAFTGYAAVVFLNTEDWQGKLPKLMVFAALIALAIGARQYYFDVIKATNKFLPDGRSVIYSVYGLMFHKNEYSSALLWMLPFLGYGIYRFKGWWRIITSITVVLILIMIVLVQTRAVWVGLAISLFTISVILILYARRLGFPLILRNIMAVGMIAGILGVTVIFSIEKPKDPRSLLGRVRSITDTRSPHNIHRLNIWKSTIQMIKEKPLTGVGANNWRLHAAYYFDGKFTEVPQLNWARPHNDYLWVFAEKGVFGFLLYLGFFGFAIFYLIRTITRTPNIQDKFLALFLFGGIISYLTVSFFNFPYERLNHQMYLGMMIAGATCLYHKLSEQPAFRPNKSLMLVSLLVFSAYGSLFGFKTVQQESNLKHALSFMHHQNWRSMLTYSQKAVNPFKSLDPLSNPPEYYEGMALAKLNRHREAIVAYEIARDQFPNNMWIINWLGMSYYNAGRFEEAVDCLERVIKIIPNHKEAFINLSATYYQMGKLQESYDALKKIDGWEKDPDVVRNMRVLENMMEQRRNSAE